MQIETTSRVTGEAIIARSKTGQAILSFDTIDRAREYVAKCPNHSLKIFKQIVTETELVL